jgi:hypothetical protein
MTGPSAVPGPTQQPFLDRWLLLTAAMFALSALTYAIRLRRATPLQQSARARAPMTQPTRSRLPCHGTSDRAACGPCGGACAVGGRHGSVRPFDVGARRTTLVVLCSPSLVDGQRRVDHGGSSGGWLWNVVFPVGIPR